jgi:hypothetical protein
METELLRKIINVYMDEHKFIPFVIKNYIEGKWNTFSSEDQLLIIRLIMFNLKKREHNIDWVTLCNWMLDNAKSTDITWDASK